jgi:hypothetical protein
MEESITLAILGSALVVVFVTIAQNRSTPRRERMLYYVIEVSHPIDGERNYWGRDPDRQVFKALDAQEACSQFARSVPENERHDRRIRRVERDEFQELGGVI